MQIQWDLISVPAQQWLDGKADKDATAAFLYAIPKSTGRTSNQQQFPEWTGKCKADYEGKAEGICGAKPHIYSYTKNIIGYSKKW